MYAWLGVCMSNECMAGMMYVISALYAALSAWLGVCVSNEFMAAIVCVISAFDQKS